MNLAADPFKYNESFLDTFLEFLHLKVVPGDWVDVLRGLRKVG